ncbi:MAG: hypothetical protein AABY53_02525 [Bdellovibrionota bacterium]
MKPILLLVFLNRTLVTWIACLACIFFAALSQAQRVGFHDESWKTVETEHFKVIFSAQQHDLGLHYAHSAEKAYQNLSQVFSKDSNQTINSEDKIVLTVNDTTDVTNGYATRIPYPLIMVFTAPVGDHDSLSESGGDWARELLTHELTHILQVEPATGFYSLLRPVFGSIVAPNLLTPLWWKEGMAVEMETQFSPRGRLRSTYQDALLRSLVLDNKLHNYTLAQANEVLPSWPYGTRPYLFGSLFFSQLTYDTKNIKASGFLAEQQGARLPYFIKQPMYELTKISYEMQYSIALRQAESTSLEQIKKLKQLPPSELKNIEQTNEASYEPSYSEKFKLLAYIENNEGEKSLALLDENGQKLTLTLNNLPSGELHHIDFHPFERKILYDKIIKSNSKYTFSDLHVYDIDTDESTQITHSQRARSASYSADGKHVVFVTTFDGKTQIRTLNTNDNAIKFILSSEYTTRYESPIFWDEQNLLVSKIDANGVYRLVKINLVSLVESPVALTFPQIRFLKKINNSLYFVSSKNGVNNIYVSKDLINAKPVSHVLNGIWSYDIAPDETRAWVSLLTGTGFKISELKLASITQDLPVIENPIQKRYSVKEQQSGQEYTYKKYPTLDYSAYDYLVPSYWIPFIAASSSSKGFVLLAQTSGHDPLKLHEYTLAANYDSELNKGNFSGIYTNSTQKIPFQLSSIVQNRALGVSTSIVETSTYAASLIPDIFSIHKNLFYQFGVQLQNTTFGTHTQHWGPFMQMAYTDYDQNIFQISPQSGWGGLLKLEKNYKLKDETGLAARDYERASFSLITFANPWLPKQHALKARISGLITFEEVLGRYGASSSSSFTTSDTLIPQFVMRGYANSKFFGRSLWNTNLEYRFPINQIERGSGTAPYFLKRLSGAVIADGIGVDGIGYSANLIPQPLKLNETIWNTGLELKLESTIGYILPMNFILGFYYPHSPLFASESQIGLSLQIGGF